jgi:hypothetical protein
VDAGADGVRAHGANTRSTSSVPAARFRSRSATW